jgi:hypothetical protein
MRKPFFILDFASDPFQICYSMNLQFFNSGTYDKSPINGTKRVTNIYLHNDAMSILSSSEDIKNTQCNCAREGKIMHSKMMTNK